MPHSILPIQGIIYGTPSYKCCVHVISWGLGVNLINHLLSRQFLKCVCAVMMLSFHMDNIYKSIKNNYLHTHTHNPLYSFFSLFCNHYVVVNLLHFLHSHLNKNIMFVERIDREWDVSPPTNHQLPLIIIVLFHFFWLQHTTHTCSICYLPWNKIHTIIFSNWMSDENKNWKQFKVCLVLVV